MLCSGVKIIVLECQISEKRFYECFPKCNADAVAKESSSVLSAQWSTLKQVSCLPILITLRTGNMYLCEILKSMQALSS